MKAHLNVMIDIDLYYKLKKIKREKDISISSSIQDVLTFLLNEAGKNPRLYDYLKKQRKKEQEPKKKFIRSWSKNEKGVYVNDR